MRVHAVRVDTAWTFTQIIHGCTCVFTFKHGVPEESAEGNVIEVVAEMRKRFGNEHVPTATQLAAWLAGMTSGAESVEVKAAIGHGAIARVVDQSRPKQYSQPERRAEDATE